MCLAFLYKQKPELLARVFCLCLRSFWSNLWSNFCFLYYWSLDNWLLLSEDRLRNNLNICS